MGGGRGRDGWHIKAARTVPHHRRGGEQGTYQGGEENRGLITDEE
jgi:hypothetical protein